MATILFISETGFPHCAFRVNRTDWYGFKPSINKLPVAPGYVDRSDCTASIKSSVTFAVPDHLAAAIVPHLVHQYSSQMYVGGIHDCVSFAADIAEKLGLKIPPRPNFLPDNFVNKLRELNADRIVS